MLDLDSIFNPTRVEAAVELTYGGALIAERYQDWARHAAALLSGICDDARRVELRYCYEERLAICLESGDIGPDEAEGIAFEHLRADLSRGIDAE